jgi:Delta7-sterol 5-desaturase
MSHNTNHIKRPFEEGVMSDTSANETDIGTGMSREWNWHPVLPLDNANPFSMSPDRIWRWFRRSWLSVSGTLVWFLLAVFAWFYLLPDMTQMAVFQVDWMAQIYAKNFVALSLVAGGLHTYFYILRGQGQQRKFERKDLAHNNRMFLFNDQVKDNMFWSLASGVTIWSAYETAYFWAFANGYVPGVTFAENPVWFVLWFPLISLWSSFHFYWVHRLIHWPPLYRLAHALHHRNINIGPWTGISMHPIEHALYFSNILIHVVAASHPMHVLYNMFFQAIGPSTSHSGFASLMIKDKNGIGLGDFFHQLHHRFFECNYGTFEVPMDRWFGTYSDGTPESMSEIRDRKRRMHSEA